MDIEFWVVAVIFESGYLKIRDVRAGMERIRLIAKVLEKSRVTIVDTRFGPAKFAFAVIGDDTGRIRLNLWREQADMVNVGDVVEIVNAFAKRFRDQIELNVGRSGKIIVRKRGVKSLKY